MTARWALQPDQSDIPRVRCARCDHGPSLHTGGYGQCWSLSCACGEYRDPDEQAACIERHPAGKAMPTTGDMA